MLFGFWAKAQGEEMGSVDTLPIEFQALIKGTDHPTMNTHYHHTNEEVGPRLSVHEKLLESAKTLNYCTQAGELAL